MEAFKAQQPIRDYILRHSIRMTPEQQELREITSKLGPGRMMSSPETTQLIHNLVFAIGAKKVLDIGVFTGVSALAEALSMPDDGKVIACDINEDFANIGKPCWEKAGVSHKIILKVADATETLDQLIAAGEAGTFDFAFIDADKSSYLKYYEKCLVLLRPRGIIAFDNVLSSGRVAEPVCEGKRAEITKAMKEVNEFLKNDERVKISMLNAGDGLTLAIKC